MFRSKEARETEAYEKAMADALIGVPVLAGKWQYFCETIHLKDDLSLLKRIQMFSNPASKWAYVAYPSLAKTNPIPWFVMLFSAVRSARTHSDEELNTTMAQFSEETNMPPLDDLVNLLPRAVPVRQDR